MSKAKQILQETVNQGRWKRAAVSIGLTRDQGKAMEKAIIDTFSGLKDQSARLGMSATLRAKMLAQGLLEPPPKPPGLLRRLGKPLGFGLMAAGGLAALGAGVSAYGRYRASKVFPLVMSDLEKRRSLDPAERVRAGELFEMLKKFGPSIAQDKNLAMSFIAQALPMSTEGTWQLINSVTRAQQQINDAQSPLAGPLSLGATAAKAVPKVL